MGGVYAVSQQSYANGVGTGNAGMVSYFAGSAEMTKTVGVIHCIAQCDTCGKQWENYKNAQAIEAKHAKLYGHIVRVDVGIIITYNGTGVPKESVGGRAPSQVELDATDPQ